MDGITLSGPACACGPINRRALRAALRSALRSARGVAVDNGSRVAYISERRDGQPSLFLPSHHTTLLHPNTQPRSRCRATITRPRTTRPTLAPTPAGQPGSTRPTPARRGTRTESRRSRTTTTTTAHGSLSRPSPLSTTMTTGVRRTTTSTTTTDTTTAATRARPRAVLSPMCTRRRASRARSGGGCGTGWRRPRPTPTRCTTRGPGSPRRAGGQVGTGYSHAGLQHSRRASVHHIDDYDDRTPYGSHHTASSSSARRTPSAYREEYYGLDHALGAARSAGHDRSQAYDSALDTYQRLLAPSHYGSGPSVSESDWDELDRATGHLSLRSSRRSLGAARAGRAFGAGVTDRMAERYDI